MNRSAWAAVRVFVVNTTTRSITDRALCKGARMIVLGILLLIVGFVAKIPIVWTLGIIVLVVGAVLAIAGAAGRQIGGRRHYY